LRLEGDLDFGPRSFGGQIEGLSSGRDLDEMNKRREVHFLQSGERAVPIRPEDSLKLEGDLDFSNAKRYQHQQYDLLSPEAKRKVNFTGERYEVKKPQGNLRLEGDLDFSNAKRRYAPDEIASPLENRRPFVGERYETKKPESTLKLEGDMDFSNTKNKKYTQLSSSLGSPSTFYPTGERFEMKKQEGSLRLEGDMDFSNSKRFVTPSDSISPGTPYRVGERYPTKRPEESLRLEGDLDFSNVKNRNVSDISLGSSPGMSPYESLMLFPSGERFAVKKHESTLRLEGDQDFSHPDRYFGSYPIPLGSYAATTTRRIIRPRDNLNISNNYENQVFEALHDLNTPTNTTISTFSEDSLNAKNNNKNASKDDDYFSRTNANQRSLRRAPRSILPIDNLNNNNNLRQGKSEDLMSETESVMNFDEDDCSSIGDGISRLDAYNFKDHLYLVGRITPTDDDNWDGKSGGKLSPFLPPLVSHQSISEDINKSYFGRHALSPTKSLGGVFGSPSGESSGFYGGDPERDFSG
jgi:hypothetical protein